MWGLSFMRLGVYRVHKVQVWGYRLWGLESLRDAGRAYDAYCHD